ncbi:MAG: bifunctional serine/threonine-protein kinase/formylglycine-generating enzyme family protein [Desulfuromusa sp.]|nr:bifunctional serine/threonine-protein kinase/formylglycine-generating enzyme family protein [Desulfuromusa sp.]
MAEKIENIGRYEIVSVLGRGAMGIVYKGYDPGIDRYVAIKTMALNLLDVDSNELEDRFRIEAKAAGRLTHPNIISIYEYGNDADRAFIAMEFVDGCTLSELEKRGKLLEINQILHIMQKVLYALQYAHERGIVHRDIKPSNIMYTPDGEVKIADFGIAHLESSTQTQLGTIIGTPGYMSPEQIMGQHVDHRSDIFSAGILLYELLTGERAFVSTNITSTTYKIVHTELPPPSKLCPTVPEAIDAVLARAFAKQPDNRFQSTSEFAEALINVEAVSKPSGASHATLLSIEKETVTVLAPTISADIPSQADANIGSTPQPYQGEGEGVLSPTADVAQKDSVDKFATLGFRKIAGVSLVFFIVLGLLLVIFKFTFTGKPMVVASTSRLPTTVDDSVIRKVPVVLPQHRPGATFTDCETCPNMVVIPTGSFLQGAPENETDYIQNEGPQHNITISYPLAVGVAEVTRGQFSSFVSDAGYKGSDCWIYDGDWKKQPSSNWLSPGFTQDDNHPVTCVSWNDAKAYTRWLTTKTGRKYRLLTESEWEYVARGGTTTAREWGNKPDSACQSANVADNTSAANYPGWNVHNCDDQFIHTAPAATFKANLFGLYDTLGNVFEWVDDCWNDNYIGLSADGSARVDGECDKRVLRGGSWYSRQIFVRSAYRNRFSPDHRSSSFGFRVARELETG